VYGFMSPVVVVLSTFAVLSHFWAFCVIMARNPPIRANRMHAHGPEHPFVELSSEQTPGTSICTDLQPDAASLRTSLLSTAGSHTSKSQPNASRFEDFRFPLVYVGVGVYFACLLAMLLSVGSTFGVGSNVILFSVGLIVAFANFDVCGD
jgi:hypothetical protein